MKCLECPTAQISECLSSFRVPKCPSAPRVPESFKCLERPSALGVPSECSSALWMPLECSLSALWVNKVCNITGNGVINSFIKFLKNFSDYIFYITLIVFSFLGKKICEFNHILLARYNHSKGFQKKFQKTKYDRLLSSS